MMLMGIEEVFWWFVWNRTTPACLFADGHRTPIWVMFTEHRTIHLLLEAEEHATATTLKLAGDTLRACWPSISLLRRSPGIASGSLRGQWQSAQNESQPLATLIHFAQDHEPALVDRLHEFPIVFMEIEGIIRVFLEIEPNLVQRVRHLHAAIHRGLMPWRDILSAFQGHRGNGAVGLREQWARGLEAGETCCGDLVSQISDTVASQLEDYVSVLGLLYNAHQKKVQGLSNRWEGTAYLRDLAAAVRERYTALYTTLRAAGVPNMRIPELIHGGMLGIQAGERPFDIHNELRWEIDNFLTWRKVFDLFRNRKRSYKTRH